jgi:hypothetical protein
MNNFIHLQYILHRSIQHLDSQGVPIHIMMYCSTNRKPGGSPPSSLGDQVHLEIHPGGYSRESVGISGIDHTHIIPVVFFKKIFVAEPKAGRTNPLE